MRRARARALERAAPVGHQGAYQRRALRALACGLLVVLAPRNYDKKSRETAAELIPLFRDYLHYHIKCSKAYLVRAPRAAGPSAYGNSRGLTPASTLHGTAPFDAPQHSRMRARVESLLKILNRARPEVQVERTKTARSVKRRPRRRSPQRS